MVTGEDALIGKQKEALKWELKMGSSVLDDLGDKLAQCQSPLPVEEEVESRNVQALPLSP